MSIAPKQAEGAPEITQHKVMCVRPKTDGRDERASAEKVRQLAEGRQEGTSDETNYTQQAEHTACPGDSPSTMLPLHPQASIGKVHSLH